MISVNSHQVATTVINTRIRDGHEQNPGVPCAPSSHWVTPSSLPEPKMRFACVRSHGAMRCLCPCFKVAFLPGSFLGLRLLFLCCSWVLSAFDSRKRDLFPYALVAQPPHTCLPACTPDPGPVCGAGWVLREVLSAVETDVCRAYWEVLMGSAPWKERDGGETGQWEKLGFSALTPASAAWGALHCRALQTCPMLF